MKRLFTSMLMIGLFTFTAWAQHPPDTRSTDQDAATAKHAEQVEKNRRKQERRYRHAKRHHRHKHAHHQA
jgi:hypothetical protein